MTKLDKKILELYDVKLMGLYFYLTKVQENNFVHKGIRQITKEIHYDELTLRRHLVKLEKLKYIKLEDVKNFKQDNHIKTNNFTRRYTKIELLHV